MRECILFPIQSVCEYREPSNFLFLYSSSLRALTQFLSPLRGAIPASCSLWPSVCLSLATQLDPPSHLANSTQLWQSHRLLPLRVEFTEFRDTVDWRLAAADFVPDPSKRQKYRSNFVGLEHRALGIGHRNAAAASAANKSSLRDRPQGFGSRKHTRLRCPANPH